jgi:monoamine oxidase
MSRAIKIALEFREAWWNEENWSASLHCDLPIQQTWDGTKGERPIIHCYICGADAEFFLKHSRPVRMAATQLGEIFPKALEQFETGVMYDWISDSFALGAFSHMAPGYVMTHLKHIAAPVGPVHFAGEHAAAWNGFIEGALESAERAVQEVLNA